MVNDGTIGFLSWLMIFQQRMTSTIRFKTKKHKKKNLFIKINKKY